MAARRGVSTRRQGHRAAGADRQSDPRRPRQRDGRESTDPALPSRRRQQADDGGRPRAREDRARLARHPRRICHVTPLVRCRPGSADPVLFQGSDRRLSGLCRLTALGDFGAKLTHGRLAHGAHHSRIDRQRAIETLVDLKNQKPKPFVSTIRRRSSPPPSVRIEWWKHSSDPDNGRSRIRRPGRRFSRRSRGGRPSALGDQLLG